MAVRHAMMAKSDPRKNKSQRELEKQRREKDGLQVTKEIEKYSAANYLSYNKNLGPPYRVLMDTSFLNSCIRMKIDIVEGMMDCLLAKAIPYVTECVLTELEKYGQKFRLALKLARDPRVVKLKCTHEHKGYGDDCLIETVKENRIYIVATSDRELRGRLRKIPGVPIMYAGMRKLKVEQLPDALK